MSANHEKVEALFNEALKFSAAERPAFLAGACGSDADLRRQLEELLKAEGQAGGFLPEAPQPAATLKIGKTELVATITEQAGDHIGNYKLREKVGEGGCGVVYVAEQEKPVRRRVALKVIKLGMDTRSVIARFEAERQALAMMDHPNIAKVLDAGATEAGRPFFVMELVRGIRITDYCDQNNLSTKDRLDLFMKVCHAIQHAHQKGIIHRDIKPSNILVTLHDGVPVPKVIDFGIAKATEGRLSDLTVYTELRQFIGTPAYMSPEQAEMSGLDIDTRSDIYALGVLLYELLVGSTPFDGRELMSLGIDAMRRTIREKEPVRPSTKLATLQGEALTTTAKCRSVDTSKLANLLRGDLDWIVMKCLEKDRTRRYETANGLAADLKRHLEHEPVTARPPSTAYKFQKAFRRNKLAFAATGAVTLALILGIVGTTVGLIHAEQQRRTAEQARKDAEAVAEFLGDILQSPDPDLTDQVMTVDQMLAVAAKRLETELGMQPDERARLQATLGRTYHNLGLYREAIPLQEKVRDYQWAAHGPEHPGTFAALSDLAASYSYAGRSNEAIEIQEKVLAGLQKTRGEEHRDTLAAMRALALSYTYRQSPRLDEALHLAEGALARQRKVLGPEHPDTLWTMNVVGNIYQVSGRNDEALQIREQLVSLRRKVLGPTHYRTLAAMGNLAQSYATAGRTQEALRLNEESLALIRKVLGSDHPETISLMLHLSSSYKETGQLDEAIKLREEALSILRKVSGPEDPGTLRAMSHLASSYLQAGRRDEELKLLEEVLPLHRKVNGPEHRNTLVTMWQLASSYAAAGRQDEALKLREEALSILRKVSGPEDPGPLVAMHNLAIYYFQAGRRDEELKLLEEVLPLYRKVNGAEHPNTLEAMTQLASSYAAAGRQDEALKLQEDVLLICRKVSGPERPDTLGTMNAIAWDWATFPDAALRNPKRAVELASEVVKLAPEVGAYANTLGVAQYRAGDYQAAIAALEKSVALSKGTEPIDGFFLAMARWQLGNKEQARKDYDLAVGLMEKTRSQDKELLRFRAEATALLQVRDSSKP